MSDPTRNSNSLPASANFLQFPDLSLQRPIQLHERRLHPQKRNPPFEDLSHAKVDAGPTKRRGSRQMVPTAIKDQPQLRERRPGRVERILTALIEAARDVEVTVVVVVAVAVGLAQCLLSMQSMSKVRFMAWAC